MDEEDKNDLGMAIREMARRTTVYVSPRHYLITPAVKKKVEELLSMERPDYNARIMMVVAAGQGKGAKKPNEVRNIRLGELLAALEPLDPHDI